MPSFSGNSMSFTNKILIFAGAATLLLLGVLLFLPKEAETVRRFQPVRELEVTFSVSPAGSPHGSFERGRSGQQVAPKLAVYLDTSQPVGGFLSPGGSPEPSGFRSVVQLVPDHLVRFSGGTESKLEWFTVASDVRSIPRPEVLHRSLFNGGETRLDLAIERILGGFESGELEAAALVTDLIATAELTGAMGVGKALADWVGSSEVSGGRFHLGLLGVRATYWGVGQGGCRGAGALGCWFSERLGTWRPLSQPASVPFFVLVLGREQSAVDGIGQSLLGDARALDLEGHWELLTQAAADRSFTATCRCSKAGEGTGRDQFALVMNEVGVSACTRNEFVALECPLPVDLGLTDLTATTTWTAVDVHATPEVLSMNLDCGVLRRAPPTGPLEVTVEGRPEHSRPDLWSSWSSETDEIEENLGRTLQLKYFVETVRFSPSSVTVTGDKVLNFEAAER